MKDLRRCVKIFKVVRVVPGLWLTFTKIARDAKCVRAWKKLMTNEGLLSSHHYNDIMICAEPIIKLLYKVNYWWLIMLVQESCTTLIWYIQIKKQLNAGRQTSTDDLLLLVYAWDVFKRDADAREEVNVLWMNILSAMYDAAPRRSMSRIYCILIIIITTHILRRRRRAALRLYSTCNCNKQARFGSTYMCWQSKCCCKSKFIPFWINHSLSYWFLCND